jgi:hypothetical protein
MKPRCLVLVAFLVAMAACSRPSVWSISQIGEHDVKFKGSKRSPAEVWDARIVFVFIDCPRSIPGAIKIENVRIEAGGAKANLEISSHADEVDDESRKQKYRRVYFTFDRDALRDLNAPVLKATVASEGFRNLVIEYPLKEAPNQSLQPTAPSRRG